MENNSLQEETLSKKLISKGFRAYLFTLFLAPFGYFIRLLASNTLSVSDVGIFYGVLSLISLLYSYNDLGLTESMQYFLPKYWLENKRGQIKNTIGISFFMQMLTGIIIFLLLFFNADRLAINHFHSVNAVNVIKVMSLYFLGYNILQVCNILFVSFQDTFSSGLIQSINMCSVFLFSLIFRLCGIFNVNIFAVSWILGVVIGISVGVGLVIKKYQHIIQLKRDKLDKTIIKIQFKYAFRVFLTTNISTLLGNVDQQLVLNNLGTESSGYFTNTQSLLNIFLTIVGPFLTLLFPVTTELSTRKEKDKFKLLESYMYTHFTFLSLIAGGLFFIFGQEIAVIFYGEKFRFSGELLQILGPFLVFNCLNTLNFYLLAGLGKIKQRFWVLLISLLVNVISNIICLYVFHLGLYSVIGVLALSRIVSFIGGFIVIEKNYPFNIEWKFIIKNIVLVLGLCGILWIFIHNYGIVNDKSRIEILGITICLGCIYLGIVVGLNRGKFKFIINEVKNFRNLN